MIERRELRVDLGVVRRRGTAHVIAGQVQLAGLEVSCAHVDEGRVDIALEVDPVGEGATATGTVTVRAVAQCRRCLEPVEDDIAVEVREVFETRPSEGETWPVVDDEIDLEPVIRETALLALPLAPLCSEDCPGPSPERFPTGPPAAHDEETESRDPRWAALDALRQQE